MSQELPPLKISELLRLNDLRPDKKLGQNFLVDQGALELIASAAEIQAQDSVLEIGAGLGNLTRLLAQQAKRVVAVELDRRLLPVLKVVLQPYQNIELVQGDILEFNPADYFPIDKDSRSYLVVANIPYYITSAVIRHLLEAQVKPTRIVLTIQQEVAERICAGPGDMSLLALSVQVYGLPRLTAHIPAGAFYPAPQVDSAVVRVDLYPQPIIPAPQLETFFRLIKAGFSQKRKNLRNALSGGLGMPASETEALLHAAGIDTQRRAETLSLEEWSRLCTFTSPVFPGGT